MAQGNQTSARKRSAPCLDEENDFEDSEHSDYNTPSPKRIKTATRKPKAAKAKSKAKGNGRNKPAKPNEFHKLPSELVLEIMSYMAPKDLFHLTRSCGSFRSILCDDSDGVSMLWERARISENHPAPAPPNGMSEMQWASLLYGADCQNCGSVKSDPTKLSFLFAMSQRICKQCLPKNLVRGNLKTLNSKLPFASLATLELLNPTDISGAGKNSLDYYYWIPDISFMSEYLALQFPDVFCSKVSPNESQKFTRFRRQEQHKVKEAKQHAHQCEIWLGKGNMQYMSEPEDIFL